MIPRVRHVKIAAGIYGHAFGMVELGRSARAIKTVEIAGHPSQGADLARRGHLADGTVDGIGQVKLPRSIGSDSLRAIKPRGGLGPVRTPIFAGQAGERADAAVRRNPADNTV